MVRPANATTGPSGPPWPWPSRKAQRRMPCSAKEPANQRQFKAERPTCERNAEGTKPPPTFHNGLVAHVACVGGVEAKVLRKSPAEHVYSEPLTHRTSCLARTSN